MNLCALPYSCGHSNSHVRNIYPVTALTSSSHAVSSHSRQSCAASRDFRDGALLLSAGLYCCKGTCILQKIQGRMQYRGSASGAVTSCSAVVANQISTNEVLAEFVPSGREIGLAPLTELFANGVLGVLTGPFTTGTLETGLAPSACMHAQPHNTYTGETAYLIHIGLISILKT